MRAVCLAALRGVDPQAARSDEFLPRVRMRNMWGRKASDERGALGSAPLERVPPSGARPGPARLPGRIVLRPRSVRGVCFFGWGWLALVQWV